MSVINTDGMSFLGPGSEWFWTAVSAVALLVTLWAIYRQVHIQTALKETQQLNEVNAAWTSERLIRIRLSIWLAKRDGQDLQALAASWRICDFWEDLAHLVHEGHVSYSSIQDLEGNVLLWWRLLNEPLMAERKARSLPDAYGEFEWLANRMLAGRSDHSHLTALLAPARVEQWIAQCRESIEIEQSLRTVIYVPQEPLPLPPTGPVTGAHE